MRDDVSLLEAGAVEEEEVRSLEPAAAPVSADLDGQDLTEAQCRMHPPVERSSWRALREHTLRIVLGG